MVDKKTKKKVIKKKKVVKKEVKEEIKKKETESSNKFSFSFSVKMDEEGLRGDVSFNPSEELSDEQKEVFENLIKEGLQNIRRMNIPRPQESRYLFPMPRIPLPKRRFRNSFGDFFDNFLF